ncbi:MAG: hypothetical protein CSA75_04515 [Sorangium cellulosum]|nr:MAG: hypothetical protein CSA75_04515 [Sorangium cellulosum]
MDVVQHADFHMIRRSHADPGLVKPSALVDRTRSEYHLPNFLTPAHAADFETLGYEGLAGCFYNSKTDRKAVRSELGIAHPPSMFAEVNQLCGNVRPSWEFLLQVAQSLDHFFYAVVFPQRYPQLGHLSACLHRGFAVRGWNCALEMLDWVEEGR